MDYSKFDIADFVADEVFVKAVLHPTPESEALWNQWMDAHPEKIKIIHEARLMVLMLESDHFELNEKTKSSLWSIIHKKTLPDSGLKEQHPIKSTPIKFSMWYKVAAILLVSIGLYFIARNFSFESNNLIVMENKKGHKSQITLPDGTKVQLNVDSRLTYPKTFEGRSIRHVSLNGEAYFDVTENSSQPFVVETHKLQIKVLGTVFNVKSYDTENSIETTLVSGQVIIEPKEANSNLQPVLLQKDQQAIYSKRSNEISLLSIETTEVTAWTVDKLVFINKPFSEIKTELERWYNVEIKVDSSINMNCRFTTSVDQQPITKILDLFKETNKMTYQIHPNHSITIKGTLCTE